MPSAAEWDSTVDAIFEAFLPQQETLTHRRKRLGAFDPTLDRHAETDLDTPVAAIAPGADVAFRPFAGQEIGEDRAAWYVKGSALRDLEPLTTNDLLVIDSVEREIMKIQRYPESGGSVALYIFEVKREELKVSA